MLRGRPSGVCLDAVRGVCASTLRGRTAPPRTFRGVNFRAFFCAAEEPRPHAPRALSLTLQPAPPTPPPCRLRRRTSAARPAASAAHGSKCRNFRPVGGVAGRAGAACHAILPAFRGWAMGDGRWSAGDGRREPCAGAAKTAQATDAAARTSSMTLVCSGCQPRARAFAPRSATSAAASGRRTTATTSCPEAMRVSSTEDPM